MPSLYPPSGDSLIRPCQRCGRPLSPNEVYCPTCSTYNAPLPTTGAPRPGQRPAGMPWGGPPPQPGSSGQQWGQNSVPSAQNNKYSGQQWGQAPVPSASQQQGYAGNLYGQAQYPMPIPTTGRGFQQNGTNEYQPGGFVRQPIAEPPPQKRGPKAGVIVGLVLLLLVLVLVGFASYAYLTNNHGTTAATPTANATPSPTPSGPPLFSDNFQNNKRHWDLTSMPGQFSVKVGGGSLLLEADNNHLLPELLPGTMSYSNFDFTVDATLSKGDPNNGYGVYIRATTDQNSNLITYYRFEFYGDGTYALFKGTLDANGNSHSSKLVDGTSAPNPAIQKQGGVNHIVITANGPNMELIVNGQPLSKINDGSYTSGTIALFVSNLPNAPPGAQATFSKLVIYPVSSK